MASLTPRKLTPLLLALAAAYPVLGHGAGAARMDFVTGNVVALGSGGASRPLGKGDEVAAGETISTRDGRAQVRFSDGSMVSLQPQTDFRVDAYNYAGKADGSEQGFFSLLKGGMRTITGLIGRTNKDSYRVTTQVATIGIRGTEYSITYGNGITITTGEGQVQVCNDGGCLLLSSGESAFVTSPGSQPVRTEVRATLPPSQPAISPHVFFAAGESQKLPGETLPPGSGMVSGPGYTVFGAGTATNVPLSSTYSWNTGFTDATTVFNANQALVSATASNIPYDLTASQTAAAFSDGTVAWGRWSTATASASTYLLDNFHYVAGKPTPGSDITALAGRTATYSLIGYTLPTSSTGLVGTQAVTGNMSINFNASVSAINLSMNVPIDGQTFALNGNPSLNGSNIGGYVTCGGCSGSPSANIHGFLAGQNASGAGLVYQFGAGGAIGDVSGAAAFKQTGLTP